MVTLAYASPFLTLATPGYRPSAAPNDTAIGFDSAAATAPSSAQLAFRAPAGISEYIGSIFDNGSYKERLTASAKTFNVPVTINGSLTVTGTCTGCGGGTGGSMTWPSSAGIAVYGGSAAWAASLTPPSSAVVGVSDTQSLINKTVDGVSPTTLGYLDATSSVQTQLNAKAPLTSPSFAGTVTLPIASGATQCLHVSGSGVVSGTGSDCGSGGSGGSGTVNSGSTSQLAMYSSTGNAVSGDPLLTDNGTTLSYSGSGGITAASGTFGGNLTVGGQLVLTGPWQVTTPPASSAMGSASSGTSSIGVSNDGNFYISANAGTPNKILTTATDAVPSVFGRTGAITGQNGDYTVSQVTGAAPTVSPTFTGTVTEPVPTLPSQSANSFFAAPSGSAGAPGFRAIVAADVPTLNQNTTGNAGSATNLAGGAVGSIPYQTAAGATVMLAGNTFASDQVLTSTGTGSAAQVPTLKNAPALSAANMTGFPNSLAGVSPAGSLATGDYVVANGYASTTDSGVLAGPYAIPWITATRGGTGATFAQNTVKMWGVVLTFPVKTTYLTYNVVAADNTTNTYDVGIANVSGAIVLNIGATAGTAFAPTTGPRTIAWSQGAGAKLQPGKYYVVITTTCASSCATISADSSSYAVTFQNAATAGTTVGGALSSFTPPADVWSWGAALPALVVK
jgi:hypothetical protein